ncbi:histidine kinase N-terminal 7TM domain-containing protein [Haloprofundus salilacus]|uniref:histidine kinase N-terminal 7TM domain-containing protein n=1 Tax=Haloprofundus salilacus TaxID=2876190 RepID=UPI001CC9C732|nr:histidine kinase N-terminal 7TM domain-containing protein [Haloprofundus salilacus]
MVSLTAPIALLLLSGAVCTLVAVAVSSAADGYSGRVRYPFAALSATGTVWAVSYAALLLAPTRSEMVPWFRLVLACTALVSTLWFVFVLAYAGHERFGTRELTAALAVEPLVVVGFATTGSSLLVRDTVVEAAAGYTTLALVPGPLYTAHVLYSFLLNAVALALLARLFVRSKGVYRKQVVVLVLAALIPLVSALPTVLDIGPALDFTPMTFWLNNGLILLALLRYRLLDVVPGAHSHLFERLDDGIVILDPDRHVVEMNRAACSALGFERTPVGVPAATVLPRASAVLSLLDDDEDHVELVVDDGTERRILDATAAADGPNGSAILVFRDITERRHAERQFRALIENSHDIVVVLDAAANFEYVSPSMEAVMGYEPSEHVHEHPFDYIHPDDREQAMTVLQRAMASGTPERAEYRYRHVDGTWRTFEAVGVSLLDDPAVEGIVISARDVTERQQYEQRLRVLNRVLRHDLRNDMNVVLGYADLLRENPSAPEVHEYARKIHHRAASLVDLADRTRFVDRTLNRAPEEFGAVDVARLVNEELAAARRNHPDATFSASASGEHWVRGDDRIRVAIGNLLENAVEHSDQESPTVDVGVETTVVDDSGTIVEVSVADDGPGIPDVERSVLESGVETPLEHGSGVGLWLASWIATEADGDLGFAENDPRGTVATLRLRGATPESEECERDTENEECEETVGSVSRSED